MDAFLVLAHAALAIHGRAQFTLPSGVFGIDWVVVIGARDAIEAAEAGRCYDEWRELPGDCIVLDRAGAEVLLGVGEPPPEPPFVFILDRGPQRGVETFVTLPSVLAALGSATPEHAALYRVRGVGLDRREADGRWREAPFSTIPARVHEVRR